MVCSHSRYTLADRKETEKAARAIAKILANIDVHERLLADILVTLERPKADRLHRIVLDYIEAMSEQGHYLNKEDLAVQCHRMLEALYE